LRRRHGAAPLRPDRHQLFENALSELVAWVRHGVRDVCVKAFQAPGTPRPADPEVEGRSRIPAALRSRELAAKPALVRLRAVEARGQVGIAPYGAAPALHRARGFQAGDRGDQV